MKDFPKQLYRGRSYPNGEICRVENEADLALKMEQGWRLTSAYAVAVETVADEPEPAVTPVVTPEPEALEVVALTEPVDDPPSVEAPKPPKVKAPKPPKAPKKSKG